MKSPSFAKMRPKKNAHEYYEKLTPALLLPWQFSYDFESDKKFALKLKQLVQIGEKHMDCVII